MTQPSRPTVTLKKSHADQFGFHVASQTLTAIYSSSNDSPEPLTQEQLQWAIFDVQALTFSTRFVIIAAGDPVWDLGWHSVKEGLAQLVHDYRVQLGTPTTISTHPISESGGAGSLWFLQTPANEYYLVAHENEADFIHLTPVPSIDPLRAHGSVDALRLLFPDNADQGVTALSSHFPDPRRQTVGLIPMSLILPSN